MHARCFLTWYDMIWYINGTIWFQVGICYFTTHTNRTSRWLLHVLDCALRFNLTVEFLITTWYCFICTIFNRRTLVFTYYPKFGCIRCVLTEKKKWNLWKKYVQRLVRCKCENFIYDVKYIRGVASFSYKMLKTTKFCLRLIRRCILCTRI